jgi:tetratricopeptide (TPR) repeat protein
VSPFFIRNWKMKKRDTPRSEECPRAGCPSAILILLFSAAACAEPFIPSNDSMVLERVPAAQETRQLQPLRDRLARDPGDLPSALQLAQGYLRIGRQTADPRFTSYAQATLNPWLQGKAPSADVLVLSATALQSSHRFAEALQLLDRALAADPRNGQAWLTKATILQVQGKFSDARGACANVLRTADQTIAVSCIAGVNSLNGKLENSYRSLAQLNEAAGSPTGELRGWIQGQLGEMAVRLGDPRTAEAHLLAALQATPGDVYLKAAYADLLLAQRRNAAVLTLLADNEQQDVLLLRLAIAGTRLKQAKGKRWADTFEARFNAAQRSGDTSHLREYARFLLDVRGDAAKSLQMAKLNWQVQREPADVQVYIKAARATRAPGADAEVIAWIRDTGFEDRTLPSVQTKAAM